MIRLGLTAYRPRISADVRSARRRRYTHHPAGQQAMRRCSNNASGPLLNRGLSSPPAVS
jgi:hypothetical protein